MELIYLYIKEYKGLFINEGFNFSSNYKVSFDNIDRKLEIMEDDISIKGYYGKNINEIVLFLGENGVGKSTLLDILGMKRDDRSEDSYENMRRIKEDCSYFIMYHLYDDYFGFEFIDNLFLSGENKIENLELNEKVERVLYKKPMDIVCSFDKKKEQFRYESHLIQKWLDCKQVKKRISFSYITDIKYNSRLSRERVEQDYTITRNYYFDENRYEYLYNYLVDYSQKNEDFGEKGIFIKNIIKVDRYIFNKYPEIEKYIHKLRNEIKEKLGFEYEAKLRLFEKKKKEEKRKSEDFKVAFLKKFYVEVIEFYFFEELIGWGWFRESRLNEIDISRNEVEIRLIKEKIESEQVIDNGEFDLLEFQYEYGLLLYIIERNSEKDEMERFKNILKYVLARVKVAASRSSVEHKDQTITLDFLMYLEQLDKECFTSDQEICISCNCEEPNKYIKEMLRLYDKSFYYQGDETSSLYKIFLVDMMEMSEGERVFLDIISRVICAINDVKGDSIVLLLDEPDKSLHPELARKFMNYLITNINLYHNESVQIVLTSHSPFIVTDILPENVYCISRKDKKEERKVENNKDTFATNIYSLLMDGFMLNNTFREYSYNQIKKIISDLKAEKVELDNQKLKNIKKVIDRIGEKALKNKLLQLYSDRLNNNKEDLIARIEKQKNPEVINKIKEVLDRYD